jgi:hypothetical protein
VPYIREDQADIRVTVDGVAYGDSWATAEGGNLEADDSKTRPGGMGYEVSLGGPASRDDLTVGTQLSDISSTWAKRLESRVGVGRVKVAITFLSPERGPIGTSATRQGVLKGVNVPDMDSTSSDAGMLELVVSCDELAP